MGNRLRNKSYLFVCWCAWFLCDSFCAWFFLNAWSFVPLWSQEASKKQKGNHWLPTEHEGAEGKAANCQNSTSTNPKPESQIPKHLKAAKVRLQCQRASNQILDIKTTIRKQRFNHFNTLPTSTNYISTLKSTKQGPLKIIPFTSQKSVGLGLPAVNMAGDEEWSSCLLFE